MYYSAMAGEDINNFSVCVLENGEVRPMSKFDDINKMLVYIDTIAFDGTELNKIEKGKYVRYKPVIVVNRFTKEML